MRDDRRRRMLRQPEEVLALVLAEDRIDEGVEKEIGARNAEMAEEVLHARSRSANEGSVSERLVLGALLADDEHARGAVGQPAGKEHRAKIPAKRAAADNRMPEAAIVRRLGEQPRPAPVGRR